MTKNEFLNQFVANSPKGQLLYSVRVGVSSQLADQIDYRFGNQSSYRYLNKLFDQLFDQLWIQIWGLIPNRPLRE